MTGADVVEEARSWIGTRFVHQGRLKHVGTDCGGLVGGVAVALGLLPADWWEARFDPRFGGYGRQPANGRMEAVCQAFMSPINLVDAAPGDVVTMRFYGDPQHLAILADYRHGGRSLIHALMSAGKVAEHRVSAQWLPKMVAAYRLPGVD